MLSVQKQQICVNRQKYFEKIIRLPNGFLAAVVFEIVEVEGQLKARVIQGRILEQGVASNKIYALPTHIDNLPIIPLKRPLFSYNFLAQKDFSFFSSQNTRAPNF